MCTIATIDYIDMKVSPIRDIFGASRKRRCKVALKWRWQSGSVDVLTPNRETLHQSVYISYAALFIIGCSGVYCFVDPTNLLILRTV